MQFSGFFLDRKRFEDTMTDPELEQDVTLAVRSLRSRFEQLAAANVNSQAYKTNIPPPLSPKAGTFPRQRASSNNNMDVHDSAIQHLRASASSSDLKADPSSVDMKALALKRTPPPPPPGKRPPLSPSPLHRPVPLPPVNGGNGESNSPPRDIASLRDRL